MIIVGTCTAGAYFSDLLSKAGLRVLVIDKDSEENLCKRLDIVHFTRDSYAAFEVWKNMALKLWNKAGSMTDTAIEL